MRSREEISDAVDRIVIEHLNCDGDDVTPIATLDELGADSLDKVELIMALEEEFGVHISDERAEEIVTIGDMVKVVVEVSGD